MQAAALRGLALSPLDRYRLPASPADDHRLVLGYGNIASSAIGAAIDCLAGALAAVS